MITLAFAQMVYFFCVQAPFTGGEDGLRAVPRGHLFRVIDLGDQFTMYYFVLAVFLLGFGLIVRTIYSPFGQVLKAIRENELRVQVLGLKPYTYKLMSFVLASMLATFGRPHFAIVISISSRRMSRTRATPRSPSTARHQKSGRPMKTAFAPSAIAFTTSAPRRMPPSRRISIRPFAAATASGSTSIVASVLSR